MYIFQQFCFISILILLSWTFDRFGNADENHTTISYEVYKKMLWSTADARADPEYQELVQAFSLDHGAKNMIRLKLRKAYYEAAEAKVEAKAEAEKARAEAKADAEKARAEAKAEIKEFNDKIIYLNSRYSALNETFDLVCHFARFLACGGTIRSIIEFLPSECFSNIHYELGRQSTVISLIRKHWSLKQTTLKNIIKSFGSYINKYETDSCRNDFNAIMVRLEKVTLAFQNSHSDTLLKRALQKLVELENNVTGAYDSWFADKETIWKNYHNVTNLPPTDEQLVKNITRIFPREEVEAQESIQTREYDYVSDITENGYVLTETEVGEKYKVCIWLMYTQYNNFPEIQVIFDKVQSEWINQFKCRSKVIHHYCSTMQRLFNFLSNAERHKPCERAPIKACEPESSDYQLFIGYLKQNYTDMAYVVESLLYFNHLHSWSTSEPTNPVLQPPLLTNSTK